LPSFAAKKKCLRPPNAALTNTAYQTKEKTPPVTKIGIPRANAQFSQLEARSHGGIPWRIFDDSNGQLIHKRIRPLGIFHGAFKGVSGAGRSIPSSSKKLAPSQSEAICSVHDSSIDHVHP
jgi:hypothetical protein